MSGGSDGAATAAATGTGGNSFLPWHLIPVFKPGDTDVNEYTRRLEFLANIWPQEHLPLLAPRACMLCEGTAFAKVVRLDPEKLRVNSVDGVKLVVKTLGGVWGQSKLEKKYERFERAIFGTVQKNDETHTSYLARHEVQYEDLMSMGATIEEMRAYILLRNSGLSSDDKKRIIVESKGELEYDKVTSALQLLGSKFFGEVQAGTKTPGRTKTYDANMIDEAEGEVEEWDEQVFVATENTEDSAFEILLAEGDEDALVMSQFEEAIVESLQSDPEIASCLNAYADARRRLMDKAKGRGFWGPSKNNKGKGKGKNKGGFKSQFRKPLAQRILESTCRICHQKGHWKAECPQRNKAVNSSGPPTGSSAFAGVSMAFHDGEQEAADGDVISELPENAVAFMVNEVRHKFMTRSQFHERCFTSQQVLHSWSPKVVQSQIERIRPDLVTRLRSICRLTKPDSQSPATHPTLPDPLSVNQDERQALIEEALFASHGSCGIVDLGASMSVIGARQFQELCQALPKTIKTQMREAPCQVSFRFGNDSTVTGRKAVFFPIGPQWIKIVVVPSNTPFLIANSVFRSLGAVIDTGANLIYFKKLDRSIPIVLTERKLYCLDFQDLLTCPQQISKGSAECHSAMTMHTHPNATEVKVSGDQNPCSTPEVFAGEKSDAEIIKPLPENSRLEQPVTPECTPIPVVEQPHGNSRPIRSASRASPQVVNGQHSKLRERREDHGHDFRRTEPVPNRLRKSSPGKTVSRSGERYQVSDLVRRDIQAQSEDRPHPISQVHRTSPQQDRRADGPGQSPRAVPRPRGRPSNRVVHLWQIFQTIPGIPHQTRRSSWDIHGSQSEHRRWWRKRWS